MRGGKDKDRIRSIFTNCLPSLGNLSDTIYNVGDMLHMSNQILEDQHTSLTTKVLPIYEALSKTDPKGELVLQKEMEAGYSKYESFLQVYIL